MTKVVNFLNGTITEFSRSLNNAATHTYEWAWGCTYLFGGLSKFKCYQFYQSYHKSILITNNTERPCSLHFHTKSHTGCSYLSQDRNKTNIFAQITFTPLYISTHTFTTCTRKCKQKHNTHTKRQVKSREMISVTLERARKEKRSQKAGHLCQSHPFVPKSFKSCTLTAPITADCGLPASTLVTMLSGRLLLPETENPQLSQIQASPRTTCALQGQACKTQWTHSKMPDNGEFLPSSGSDHSALSPLPLFSCTTCVQQSKQSPDLLLTHGTTIGSWNVFIHHKDSAGVSFPNVFNFDLLRAGR